MFDRIFGLSATLIVLVGAGAARASDLYGHAHDQGLFRLDQQTGAATLIGATTSIIDSRDLASDTRPGSFRIFLNSFTTDGLYRLDPATAAVTHVGTFDVPADAHVRSIAFDVTTGRLFGIAQLGTLTSLYRIDPDTADVTFVADMGAGIELNGAAFDLQGNLFAVDRLTRGLLRIDPSDGAMTLAAAFPADSPVMSDIAFRPEDGRLFAISQTGGILGVYTLDLAAQTVTLVGPFGQPLNVMAGLAFGPAVPEPASMLLPLASAGLALRRRTRRTS